MNIDTPRQRGKGAIWVDEYGCTIRIRGDVAAITVQGGDIPLKPGEVGLPLAGPRFRVTLIVEPSDDDG